MVGHPLPCVYGLRANDYVVEPIGLARARDLVERFHYAGGAGNTGRAWGLFHREAPAYLLAATIWLPPPLGAAKAVASFYGPTADPRGVYMLSRSVAAPWAPPNASTFTIGASIRQIRALRRWTHLVTHADTYQTRVPVAKRIPGRIYAGCNWSFGWLGEPRTVWVDAQTARLMSRYSAGATFNASEMRARGAVVAGKFPLICYVFDLTVGVSEQAEIAHARNRGQARAVNGLFAPEFAHIPAA